MDNKISFTGFKNIGGFGFIKPHNIDDLNIKVKKNYLLVQLTNDFNGKDLNEFKDIIKKCSPDFKLNKFTDDDSFIRISTREVENEDIESEIIIPQLVLNGKEVDITNKTIPLFSYIAKLTKRIAAAKDKDLLVNEDFKYGPDGNSYLLPEFKISDLANALDAQIEKVLDYVYSSKESKNFAQKINLQIQKQMENYFEV